MCFCFVVGASVFLSTFRTRLVPFIVCIILVSDLIRITVVISLLVCCKLKLSCKIETLLNVCPFQGKLKHFWHVVYVASIIMVV